jgi:diaminopimelate epimerase
MIRFTKMQGLGNDFVVFETTAEAAMPSPERWRAWSHRKTGIGFDQALVIQPARSADTSAFYRIFNADGSEVEQCGNGARCVAEWLRRHRGLEGSIRLESRGGRIEARFEQDGLVSVDMGEPRFFDEGEIALSIDTTTVRFTRVSMGNPHIVLSVPDVDSAPVAHLGPILESHPMFPQKTNVGFLQFVDRQHARLRVFERGVGETLACGTGACAAMAVGRRDGRFESTVAIDLTGGRLWLRWDGPGSHLWMTGPAVVSFEGSIEE